MSKKKSASTACEQYARILSALEAQLASLDRAGAHKAAAHLDAAVHQLRRDQLALELASAARETPAAQNVDSVVSELSMAPISEQFHDPQVFVLKAKPANAR